VTAPAVRSVTSATISLGLSTAFLSVAILEFVDLLNSMCCELVRARHGDGRRQRLSMRIASVTRRATAVCYASLFKATL